MRKIINKEGKEKESERSEGEKKAKWDRGIESKTREGKKSRERGERRDRGEGNISPQTQVYLRVAARRSFPSVRRSWVMSPLTPRPLTGSKEGKHWRMSPQKYPHALPSPLTLSSLFLPFLNHSLPFFLYSFSISLFPFFILQFLAYFLLSSSYSLLPSFFTLLLSFTHSFLISFPHILVSHSFHLFLHSSHSFFPLPLHTFLPTPSLINLSLSPSSLFSVTTDKYFLLLYISTPKDKITKTI